MSKFLPTLSLNPKPKRPERISTLMEVAERIDDNELELYKKFLISVEKAQRDMFSIQSACTITMYHKFESYSLAGPRICLLYTSPSPRDATLSRMPSSA